MLKHCYKGVCKHSKSRLQPSEESSRLQRTLLNAFSAMIEFLHLDRVDDTFINEKIQCS